LSDQLAAKRQAANAALKEVQDGMLLGLGTGSTAEVFVDALIERVRREGLKVTAICTSERTEAQARAGGIPITDFTKTPVLDATFDGADVADLRTFALLKGLGGALLREKIVAQASKRLVIMVDPSKLPPVFGGPLPIEIVQFGVAATMAKLEQLGKIHIRPKPGSADPYLTDGGNYIADLICDTIPDPQALQSRIKNIAGVIETGLFIGMASMIIVGTETGAQIYRPHNG
jgi:ribose 5-phosphate isomerase A